MESPASPDPLESLKSQQPPTRDSIAKNQYATVTCIHDLYHYALRNLGQVIKRNDCKQCADSFQDPVKRCLSLLYMWAQGLDLNFLQNAIDQDTGLQTAVVKGLAAIVTIVHAFLDDAGNHRDRDRDPDLVREDADLFIKTYANNGFSIDDDTESSSSSSSDSDSGSCSSLERVRPKSLHSQHGRQLSRLKMHVQCLMDLLPTIEHCCHEKRSGIVHTEVPILAHDNVVDHVILPYVMQVQDKFASIDPILATRLGEANWTRYQRLQTLKTTTADESGSEDSEVEDIDHDLDNKQSMNNETVLQPHSEFLDSGLGASIPAKSRYNPSVVSHTSLLSTQSAINRGSLRVPPTPIEVAQGRSFECQICGIVLSQIRNRVDWKLHVFADIQPYICIFANCPVEKNTFPSRKHWAAHDIQEHRRTTVWRCFKCNVDHDTAPSLMQHLDNAHTYRVTESSTEEKMILEAARALVTRMANQMCPMCKKKGFKDDRDWTSHVARHMEEIALIVLPRDLDSDDGEDNEDSASEHDTSPKIQSTDFESKRPIARVDLAHNDENEDDDEDILPPRKIIPELYHLVLPTLDGFRKRIRQLNPPLEPYLAERLAQDQYKRYERLRRKVLEHRKNALENGRCLSGPEFCVHLGGQPKLFHPHTSKQDITINYAQPKEGTMDSDKEEAFHDIVTALAVFPIGIPLPPVTHLPAEFECPLCFQVKQFQKPSDWTKHVYEDVQPFSCTFQNCPNPRTFKRFADWRRHENERHRHLEWWRCYVSECAHVFYRKDNFVQHLVREHNWIEPPKYKRGGARNLPLVSAQASSAKRDARRDAYIESWSMVEACRVDTDKSPSDEPCKFCGYVGSTWKKLSVHMGKHMEQIAMPTLHLFMSEAGKTLAEIDQTIKHDGPRNLICDESDFEASSLPLQSPKKRALSSSDSLQHDGPSIFESFNYDQPAPPFAPGPARATMRDLLQNAPGSQRPADSGYTQLLKDHDSSHLDSCKGSVRGEATKDTGVVDGWQQGAVFSSDHASDTSRDVLSDVPGSQFPVDPEFARRLVSDSEDPYSGPFRGKTPSDIGAVGIAPTTAEKIVYLCPYAESHNCVATFTTSSHAARHGKRHTGKNGVHCPICNKAFAREDDMKQHEQDHYNTDSENSDESRNKAAITKRSSEGEDAHGCSDLLNNPPFTAVRLNVEPPKRGHDRHSSYHPKINAAMLPDTGSLIEIYPPNKDKPQQLPSSSVSMPKDRRLRPRDSSMKSSRWR